VHIQISILYINIKKSFYPKNLVYLFRILRMLLESCLVRFPKVFWYRNLDPSLIVHACIIIRNNFNEFQLSEKISCYTKKVNFNIITRIPKRGLFHGPSRSVFHSRDQLRFDFDHLVFRCVPSNHFQQRIADNYALSNAFGTLCNHLSCLSILS